MKFSHSTITASGIEPSGNSSPSTRVHNLRATAISGAHGLLEPVGRPEIIAREGWRPLVEMTIPDELPVLIAVRGLELATVIDDPEAPISMFSRSLNVQPFATLAAEPVCAVAGDCRVTVMTHAGPEEWHYSPDSATWMKFDPKAWPAIALMPEDTVDYSADVPRRRLSTDYSSHDTALTDADRHAVTADMRRAYAQMTGQAAASGDFCAPMVMRYRLIGHDGACLFLSPPLMLGAKDNRSLTASYAVISSDRRTLDSYSTSVRGWRLHIASSAAIPADMAAAVSRIELIASPPVHPFNPKAEARIDLLSTPGSSAMLRVSMPGMENALSPDNTMYGEVILRGLSARIEKTGRIIGVVQGPFTAGQPLDLYPALDAWHDTVAKECEDLRHALDSNPDIPRPDFNGICVPHSFAAGCAASASGLSVWGNLNSIRFNGYTAESFAASFAGDGAWHAAVAVTFANGVEQVVALSQGESRAPASFNPLLSYPAPDARSITLIVSTAGELRRQTFPLSPDRSGRRSIFMHPSFKPFTLPAVIGVAFVPPLERRLDRPLHTVAALSPLGDPGGTIAMTDLGAEIEALFPAARLSGGWDSSRPRFTAFTAAGISTVVARASPDPAAASLASTSLDCRSLDSPQAACMAGGRLLAAAGGDLDEVGSSAVRTLVRGFPADRLAYDSDRAELWTSRDDSPGSVVLDLDTMLVYTRDESLTGAAIGCYAMVDGDLCHINRQLPRDSLFVEWSGTFDLGNNYVRPKLLSLDMRSSAVSHGSLAFSRVNLTSSEPLPGVQVTIDGSPRSPLSFAAPALPLRRASFSLQGRVAPDTVISSITIYYESARNNL